MKKTLVLLITLLSLTACQQKESYDLNQFKNFSHNKDELKFKLEYGEDFDQEHVEYMLLKDGFNTIIEPIDSKKMGDTDYKVTVDEKERVINVTVVDTQAPVIKGDLKYTITEGDALDLNKKITAEDPVDGKVDVEFSEFDNKKIGVQKVTAVAKDVNGNETKAEVEITVEEKVVVQAPVNKPSGGSSSSGNTSKPSGGSSSGNTSKPSGNMGGNSGSSGNSGNTSKPSGGSSSSETWPGKNEGYDRDGWKTLGTLKSKGKIITIEHDLYGKSNHIIYSTDNLFIIIAPGETEWGYNSVISSGGGSSESAAILYEAAHEHYEANGYINR